ncbi:MAG: hypothetical protein OIF40_15000 [Mangrovicoccus sp.]|nr:hypothetical protein [Mangrovicoccus sp.]
MENTLTPSVNAAAGTVTAGPAPSALTEASGPAISSDFETFLVMLTAQIQNQDPLNPIDSTDYAVQLATFSGVEQQVLTNELLRDMTGTGLGMSALTDLAGWVGMEGRILGELRFSGQGVDLHFDPMPGLRDGHVEIRNSSDALVARIPVTGSQSTAYWDGRNSYGAVMPDGVYSTNLTGKNASGGAVQGDVSSYVQIQEARIGPSGPELRLADNRVVTPDEITALRPGASQ